MKRLRLAVIVAGLGWMILAALVIPAPLVAAHEHVIVGSYELTVGWRIEPAIVGVLNGLDLGIEQHFANNTTAWVVGVQGDLNATLTTGPKSLLSALQPQDGRPGWYTFDFIPTIAAVYSVRIVGTLNTTAVDVTVNLDPVAPASNYEFPVSQPSPIDLQNSIDQLNAQLAAMQTLLTILIAVAVIAVVVAAGSLVFAVRVSRATRRSP